MDQMSDTNEIDRKMNVPEDGKVPLSSNDVALQCSMSAASPHLDFMNALSSIIDTLGGPEAIWVKQVIYEAVVSAKGLTNTLTTYDISWMNRKLMGGSVHLINTDELAMMRELVKTVLRFRGKPNPHPAMKRDPTENVQDRNVNVHDTINKMNTTNIPANGITSCSKCGHCAASEHRESAAEGLNGIKRDSVEHDIMKGICHRIVGSTSVADDAVQAMGQSVSASAVKGLIQWWQKQKILQLANCPPTSPDDEKNKTASKIAAAPATTTNAAKTAKTTADSRPPRVPPSPRVPASHRTVLSPRQPSPRAAQWSRAPPIPELPVLAIEASTPRNKTPRTRRFAGSRIPRLNRKNVPCLPVVLKEPPAGPHASLASVFQGAQITLVGSQRTVPSRSRIPTPTKRFTTQYKGAKPSARAELVRNAHPTIPRAFCKYLRQNQVRQ